MSNELIIKGQVQIDDMNFHRIEGGFGKDKRAMLSKDIAVIHNRELKEINRRINENRARFKEGIDIIDLKTGASGSPVLEVMKQQGIFTQAEIGNANNIYVLSERGYAKLLKILEDDVAWEQYEKLVDGYFNMRQSIKKRFAPIFRIVKDEIEIAQTIAEAAGVKPGIALATAINRVEKRTGTSMEDYRLLLPAAEHEVGMLKVKEIGERLGDLKSVQVNQRLEAAGLQYSETHTKVSKSTGKEEKVKTWHLTEEGAKYGELFPYSNNGHSGYEIRWAESVIDIFEKEGPYVEKH